MGRNQITLDGKGELLDCWTFLAVVGDEGKGIYGTAVMFFKTSSIYSSSSQPALTCSGRPGQESQMENRNKSSEGKKEVGGFVLSLQILGPAQCSGRVIPGALRGSPEQGLRGKRERE